MEKLLEGWILAGQSNMEGYGLLNDARSKYSPNPKVISLSSRGNWETAKDPLQWLWESSTPAHALIMREGLHEEKQKLSNSEFARIERVQRFHGVGAGCSFGTERSQVSGQRVALIPCAHGGTLIEQWMPNYKGRDSYSMKNLYGSMLYRVRLAKATSDISLSGLIWYQGESDADTGRSANYANQFKSLIESLRSDLLEPELKVLVVQVGRFVKGESQPQDFVNDWNSLRDTQRMLADPVSKMGVVSAIDLGLSDEIHLDTPSQERLGKRLNTLLLQNLYSPMIKKVSMVSPTANGYTKVRVEIAHATGPWNPGPMQGFSLTDCKGNISTKGYVISAYESIESPGNIDIVIGPSGVNLGEDHYIGYGLGYSPICNVVDAADMPLPAFGPIKLSVLG